MKGIFMKITEVDMPEVKGLPDGLGNIKMERLGSIVLIAGKNGSGKTRLLGRIRKYTLNRPSNEEKEVITKNINLYEQKINSNPQNKDIIDLKERLTCDKNKLAFLNYISFSEYDKNLVYDYVPKSLTLVDCDNLSKKQFRQYASLINQIGIGALGQGTISRIQNEQDRFYNAKDISEIPITEKENAYNSYNALNSIIQEMLGAGLTRSIDGEAQIYGKPIGQANLSDGQKILLQFCLAIHSQGATLGNLVLLMDEPENHIHPSVLFEVLDKISKINNNGQIWIATHSISLLSHFDASNIWYMENNNIYYAGREPERVLKGLLGDEDQISRLSDFLTLPIQFASNQYAYECLFQPKAVQTGIQDTQTNQIRNEIKKHEIGKKIRILDFGAGKGRLADSIYYSDDINDKFLLQDWLDYIAYDEFNNDEMTCKCAIKKIYGTADKRYFNNFNKLQEEYDDETFDVIVMCNVLHEIDPKEWLKLFSENGAIYKFLKTDGFLLLVEDELIPVGEKAYQNGYVVLNTAPIKKLFNINENDADFKIFDARKDSRLMAFRIPKSYLMRITAESRILALECVAEQAKRGILDLRKKAGNYKTGKKHGFYTQQFANATLCLDELKIN
jgi:ABC-type cobalamin/Fe3+-siderophores transport system ATPase subunit